MAGLIQQIAEINRLAELSPGYIWRLTGDRICAESLFAFDWLYQPFDPDLLFYNMSVWENVDSLKKYVYRTTHVSMLRDKTQWIDPAFAAPHLALWWIEPEQRPTIAESADRLRSLRDHGATEFAFTFRELFPTGT